MWVAAAATVVVEVVAQLTASCAEAVAIVLAYEAPIAETERAAKTLVAQVLQDTVVFASTASYNQDSVT